MRSHRAILLTAAVALPHTALAQLTDYRITELTQAVVVDE
jgi:hypothetical protein